MMKQKSYKHLWTCMCVVLGLLCTVFLTNINTLAESSLKGNEINPEPSQYICDYNQLKEFASTVNSGQNTICGILHNDIECSGDEWIPIGNDIYQYNGIFNGQGYTIKNLSNKDKSTNYAGLFGCVGKNGIVQNVRVENGNIVGNTSVGGIAGKNHGTISQCSNNSTVNGKEYVGGIVGSNENNVACCYNTGRITGDLYTGGIAGSNENNVACCYNTGRITGDLYTGGIAGQNTKNITNCYNTGLCYAEKYDGGLVGSNRGKINTCYNIGSINGEKSLGVFIGTGPGSITNCYFDSDIVRKGTESCNDSGGLHTDQMTGTNALENMSGFSPDVWLVKDNDKNYMYYPHLKGFNLDKDGKQLSAKDITAEDWPPKLNKNDSGTWDQTTDPAQKSTDENNNTDIIDPILNGDTENNKSSSDTSYTEGSHTYTTANGTNYTSDTHTYKTADTVTINGFVELGILMMLALMGLYLSLKKKKI